MASVCLPSCEPVTLPALGGGPLRVDSTRVGSGPRRLAGKSQTTSPQSFCVFLDIGKVGIPDIDVTL